jgi:hypothetical protein
MNSKLKALPVASCLGGTLALGMAIGSATADQPTMHAALDDLRQARQQLVAAAADKGGRRANAIRLVDQAIDEVKEGMRFDRAHCALRPLLPSRGRGRRASGQGDADLDQYGASLRRAHAGRRAPRGS